MSISQMFFAIVAKLAPKYLAFTKIAQFTTLAYSSAGSRVVALKGTSNWCIAGYSNIVTSNNNGATWSVGTQLKTTTWGNNGCQSGTTNAGKFYMVSYAKHLCESTDGLNWTYQAGFKTAVGSNQNPYSILGNGSKLVAGSGGKTYSSPDGITWTLSTQLGTTTWGTNTVYFLAWDDSKWLAISDTSHVATSTDGATWTYQPALKLVTSFDSSVAGLIWTGTKFVALDYSRNLATSPDGITWTYSAALLNADFLSSSPCMTWDGTYIVVVGALTGSYGTGAYSTDGITWVNLNPILASGGVNFSITGVASNGKELVVTSGGLLATSKLEI